MNWYVTQKAEEVSRSAPTAIPDWWESAGSSWEAETIERDLWGWRRKKTWERFIQPMAKKYLEEDYHDLSAWSSSDPAQGSSFDPAQSPAAARLFVLAAADPDRPPDMASSFQEVESQMQDYARKTLADARAVNQMGGATSQFIGGVARSATSPVGVASMVIGGPSALAAKTFIGGVARSAAFEGVLGGVDGAISAREKAAHAPWLGVNPPDVASEIIGGFGMGLATGTVLGAGVRGLDYALRRRDVGAPPPGVDLRDHIAATDATARALETGAPLPAPPPARPTLTPELVDAVIWQESRGKASAKGPELKRADGTVEHAWGLMQVRPSTARDPGYGVPGLTGTDDEIIGQLTDPAKNRAFGEAYLGAMLQRYDNVDDALVAYNWGPGNADTWIAANRPRASLPKQTTDYVTSIRRRMASQNKATPSAPINWAAEAERPAPAVTGSGVRLPPILTTPGGAKIDVAYEIVDLAQLRAATGDLQPRDRTRAGSREQIAHMAAKLDPDQLMPSAFADRGAPLVGPDDIVESGNGRVAAIRMAADSPETGRYAAYLDQLRDLGFEVPATGQPVLVARRRSELDDAGRRALVTDANASAVMRFSPTEQALIDAEALPMNALAQFDHGDQIFSTEGVVFVRSMLDRLPETERNGLYKDKNYGAGLNDDGRKRIEAAIFARAYEAPDLIAAKAETSDAASAGMIRALTQAAPHWASLRHEIAEGRIDPRFDVTEDLTAAVRTVAQARRDAASQKRPVATVLDEAMRQSDLERGAMGEAQQAFVRAFTVGGRARAAEETAEMLRGYVDSARRQSDPTPDLFGDPAAPSPLEALAAGLRRVEAEAPEASPAARGASGAEASRNLTPPSAATLARFEDGASSPVARAAADAEEEDLRKLLAEIGEDLQIPDDQGNMRRAVDLLNEGRAWIKAAEAVALCKPKRS